MTPRRPLLTALAASPLLWLVRPGPAEAAAPIAGAEAMAAHRAAYTLALDSIRDGSNVGAAGGTMLYEVQDACDGWTTLQRMTISITDRDGQTIETVSEYSTYESKDARTLRFTLTQTTEGAVTQQVAGVATMTPDGPHGGTVAYTSPETKTVTLPQGTVLPMQHTIRVLAAARAQEKILVRPLFDGTDDNGAQDSTTILFGWTPPQASNKFPALAKLGSARLHIAFFDHNQDEDAAGGAATPDYEVTLRYYENGVADDLRMDFGDFAVKGQLKELKIAPKAC